MIPLYPYQEAAVDWVYARDHSLLAVAMGAGKTRVVLQALHELLEARVISRVLIVAPLRVAAAVWPQEAQKWGFEPIAVATGPQRIRQHQRGGPRMVVTNYDVLDRDLPALLHAGYDALVIDESTRVKNWVSKRTKALRKLRPTIKWVTALSGTPVTQGLEDLFAQVSLLDQGAALGTSVTKYRSRYFYTVNQWDLRPRPGALEAVLQRCPWIYRIPAGAYKLGELHINDIQVPLPPAALATYRKLKADLLAEIDGQEISATSAAALVGKLAQAADGLIYDEAGTPRRLHDAKLDALGEIIDSQQGAPLLVLYRFTSTLSNILRRWPHARTIDSDTIDAWNRGEVPLLVGHPASCGHGLNLQAGGAAMVFVGLPYSLELYLQSIARLHRGGQSQPVWVHRLLATDTIDPYIARDLQGKDATLQALLKILDARGDVRATDLPPEVKAAVLRAQATHGDALAAARAVLDTSNVLLEALQP